MYIRSRTQRKEDGKVLIWDSTANGFWCVHTFKTAPRRERPSSWTIFLLPIPSGLLLVGSVHRVGLNLFRDALIFQHYKFVVLEKVTNLGNFHNFMLRECSVFLILHFSLCIFVGRSACKQFSPKQNQSVAPVRSASRAAPRTSRARERALPVAS